MAYSRRNFWLLLGIGVLVIMSAHLLPHATHGAGLWSVPAVGFGLLMTLGCALGGLSYGAMDDIQKQNMKSDWYWGSLIGLSLFGGVVLPLVLFGSGPDVLRDLLSLRSSPRGYFFAGVMVTLMLFAGGWVLAFLFRRLSWMK
jgi:hypothetical protein